VIDKPKAKVEDVARRRIVMGRLRAYLIVLLIELFIAANGTDSIGQLALIAAYGLGTTIAFILFVFPDKPLYGDKILEIVATTIMVGTLLFVYLPDILRQLGG